MWSCCHLVTNPNIQIQKTVSFLPEADYSLDGAYIFNRLFINWVGHIQKYQHAKTGRYCNWWTKYKVIGSLFSSCFNKYWLLYRESLYKFSLGVWDGTWEGKGYRHLFILVFNLHSFILYGLLYCLSSYYIPSFDVPCSSSLFCFVIMSVKNC